MPRDPRALDPKPYLAEMGEIERDTLRRWVHFDGPLCGREPTAQVLDGPAAMAGYTGMTTCTMARGHDTSPAYDRTVHIGLAVSQEASQVVLWPYLWLTPRRRLGHVVAG